MCDQFAHNETLKIKKSINRWRFMFFKTVIAQTAGGLRNHGFSFLSPDNLSDKLTRS
jgi:hypothetical protein